MSLYRTPVLAGLMACSFAGAAQAEVLANLSFVTPTATVAPQDDIEVWIRLSLDSNSDELVIDGSHPPFVAGGFDLPATAPVKNDATQLEDQVAFASYSSVFLNTFYSCSGTFAPECADGEPGSAYRFDFWLDNTKPAKPTITFQSQFSLQPGQSYDYLFGIFSPIGGAAPAGTYTFYDAGLTIQVDGLDASGKQLTAEVAVLASTCESEVSSCAFVRTVVTSPVPEPGAGALTGMGLLALLGWQRRRRAT